ncbi:universal stress protein [Streptomyces atratus]|uniref:universal stress protein n=1 Tax=Streptomyces atratus TaxID=1893 RepID=UPI003400C0DD
MTDTPAHVPAGPIVVGTDGSPHARQAVLFALREAQLRDTSLRAVCVYGYAPARYTAMDGWPCRRATAACTKKSTMWPGRR